MSAVNGQELEGKLRNRLVPVIVLEEASFYYHKITLPMFPKYPKAERGENGRRVDGIKGRTRRHTGNCLVSVRGEALA